MTHKYPKTRKKIMLNQLYLKSSTIIWFQIRRTRPTTESRGVSLNWGVEDPLSRFRTTTELGDNEALCHRLG